MNAAKTILTASVTTALCIVGCSAQQAEQGSADQTETSVHLFQCETQEPMADGVKHTMTFSVVGLNQPGFDEDFVWPEDEDDENCPGCPVTVTPEDSDFIALNENGGVRREDGKLIVDGDADGFYWAYLVMYEDSGYTRGYVRIEDGGGFVDEAYGKASCTVTEVTPEPAGPPVDSEIYGFYLNYDYEWDGPEPIVVALYPPGPEGLGEYAGYVDYAPFDEQNDISELHQGKFRITGSPGAYEIHAETDAGEPMTASTWRIDDGALVIDGKEMFQTNHVSDWTKQCYGLQVLEYEFEEGFTPYEYPGVDVRLEDGHYEVSFGCTNFDHTEAEITVTESEQGDFEAVVVTNWSTYVLRVPAGTPSRGQVLFGDSLDNLEVMANVGCY